MEKQSDRMAVKFFAENNYPMEDIVGVLNKMYHLQELDKKNKHHVVSNPLFRSHPVAGRRIKLIRRASKNISQNNPASNQLDQTAFAELKKRTTDECIYYYFSNFQFNNCLAMAYKMHLQHPADEFYLYFIVESLRRMTTLFPFTKQQKFLISDYKFKNNKAEEKNTSSIHGHIKEFYPVTDSMIANWPDHALLDPRTVEFTTNEEALNFFTNYALTSCKACLPGLKRMNISTPDSVLNKSLSGDIARYLIEESFFTEADTANYSKNAFFFNNAISGKFSEFKYSIEPIVKTSQEQKEFLKFRSNKGPAQLSEMDSQVDFGMKLQPWESELIQAAMNTVSKKLVFDNFKHKQRIRKKHYYRLGKRGVQTKINFQRDFPELYLIASKYQLQKIYFMDLLDRKPANLSHTDLKKGKINSLLYCIDFEKQTVQRARKKFGFRYWSKAEFSNLFPDMIDSVVEMEKTNGFSKIKYKSPRKETAK